MADRISKLPRSKKIPPIDVVRARLRNHVDVVLASDNEVLIRMIERFFAETIDSLIQERPKGEVVRSSKRLARLISNYNACQDGSAPAGVGSLI